VFELRDIDAPYPGLRPFEPWEKEIFFGREAHTERLLEILGKRRFLAVIGPSGSGKSSLVRAGLLPELPRGRLGTGTRWRFAVMKPGNAPIQHLARALLQRQALGEALLADERIPADSETHTLEMALLDAELRRGDQSLTDLALRATQRQAQADEALKVKRPPMNLLLLVDQFEELFTYLDAGGTDQAARRALEDEAGAFVDLLLRASAAPAVNVYVVLTMRTDFLGACVRFQDLPDAINRGQYLTPRLRHEEIERAITAPAESFGGSIAPALVQEMINAVSTDPDQLPLLQHALGRMWLTAHGRAAGGIPQIELSDFKQAGGVREALAIHAESVLVALAGQATVTVPLSPQQAIARELFSSITEQRSGDRGGQIVRRPQELQRIAQRSGRACGDFEPVLEAFGAHDVNFLTFLRPAKPDTVIDISHEALIRHWDRLNGWVAVEARRAGEFRGLRAQAAAHAAGEVGSALLSGAALTRALEWWSAGGTDNDDGWRPVPAWAARYAELATLEGASREIGLVGRYIGASQAAVAAEAAMQQQAEQDAKDRSQQQEREQLQREKDAAEREAERQLFAEQKLRFLAEERRSSEALAAGARQRSLNWALGAALVVAIGAAGFGINRYSEAERQRMVIEGQSLWLPLSFDNLQTGQRDLDALI